MACDRSFHMLSVRIGEVAIRVGAYDMNLCVFPDWNLEGKFQPYLVGEFQVPVDVEQDDASNIGC